MPETFDLNGTTYTRVTEQRSGAGVYRSGDRYLRLGPPSVIKQHIDVHSSMERAGYPVAPILERGIFGESGYFIEQSLGDKTFRTIFAEEAEQKKKISEESFAEFLRISERYLKAQAKALVTRDDAAFTTGIHMDILREELPQYTHSLKEKMQRILEKTKGFPFVLSHGDFNPSNMYPLGIIDLEDSFSAPFGYDAMTAIGAVEWFPIESDFEFYAHYQFTADEKQIYLAMCDSVSRDAGYPAISSYYDDFLFCRGVWSAVRMHKWPKLQKWRFDKFIKTYLFY